ncbi:hypothetical protein TWF696_005088 [Orbilia brochopaga]|uniref:Uncharacterized protein n=1 Tax=Orbilia brochopaga TaxID=3140254 RepID=A0AAV9V3K7_9PEZI
MRPEEIFHQIVAAIKASDDKTRLDFDDISPETAEWLYQSLYDASNNLERRRFKFCYNSDRQSLHISMPTKIHESVPLWLNGCCGLWALKGLVPDTWYEDVGTAGNPRFDNFSHPYEGSIKEPDGVMLRMGHDYPVLVVEVNWSESWAKLEEDRALWMRGFGQNAPVVILVKFSDSQNGVRGTLEIAFKRAGGTVTSRKTIWSIPDEDEEDPYILLGDIYGSSLPAGFDPLTRLPMEMSRLRRWGDELLRHMNLTSA